MRALLLNGVLALACAVAAFNASAASRAVRYVVTDEQLFGADSQVVKPRAKQALPRHLRHKKTRHAKPAVARTVKVVTTRTTVRETITTERRPARARGR